MAASRPSDAPVTIRDGPTIGILGALEAFPRRLAVRAVAQRGGHLRRGLSRGITLAVVGRRLLRRTDADLEAAVARARASGAQLVGESGFLRWLGLLPEAPEGPHDRAAMLSMSGLAPAAFDHLVLFDAFEREDAPFGFRDLVLARKYAAVLGAGASWAVVARAVHRLPRVGAAASLTLDVEAEGIIARRPGWSGEIDGQGTLALEPVSDRADDTFEAAEAAEAEGDCETAATLYNRCLSLDPGDAVAAFNRANCLAALGRPVEAAHDYARAVKRDPGFVEAWFNLAGLMRQTGHDASARRHLRRAIGTAPDYADAIFNLAMLEYDAGEMAEAARLLRRYLELDSRGEWADRARNGLRLIAIQAAGAGTG